MKRPPIWEARWNQQTLPTTTTRWRSRWAGAFSMPSHPHKMYKAPVRCRTGASLFLLSGHLRLDAVLHIPDKGPKALHLCFAVETAQTLQQRRHFFVWNNSKDGFIKGRPGVGAHMRFPINRAPALYLIPAGKTTQVQLIQYKLHFFSKALIVGYKHGFHKHFVLNFFLHLQGALLFATHAVGSEKGVNHRNKYQRNHGGEHQSPNNTDAHGLPYF